MWIQRNHDTESSEVEQADFSVNQEIRSLIDHESSGEGLKFNELEKIWISHLWHIFQGFGYEWIKQL